MKQNQYVLGDGKNHYTATIAELKEENERAQIADLPEGGNANEVLIKKSNTDFDAKWAAIKELIRLIEGQGIKVQESGANITISIDTETILTKEQYNSEKAQLVSRNDYDLKVSEIEGKVNQKVDNSTYSGKIGELEARISALESPAA